MLGSGIVERFNRTLLDEHFRADRRTAHLVRDHRRNAGGTRQVPRDLQSQTAPPGPRSERPHSVTGVPGRVAGIVKTNKVTKQEELKAACIAPHAEISVQGRHCQVITVSVQDDFIGCGWFETAGNFVQPTTFYSSLQQLSLARIRFLRIRLIHISRFTIISRRLCIAILSHFLSKQRRSLCLDEISKDS